MNTKLGNSLRRSAESREGILDLLVEVFVGGNFLLLSGLKDYSIAHYYESVGDSVVNSLVS